MNINYGMSDLQILHAKINDIEEIVVLLMDDVLGRSRENADMALYETGLSEILLDDNNYFFVAKLDLEIVGCFQLTFIPSLSRGASKRGQIESVRVKTKLRGQNIGTFMMQWAIDFCKENGCSLVQLTTDKQRVHAHKFYENLGFANSHVGMKLKL